MFGWIKGDDGAWGFIPDLKLGQKLRRIRIVHFLLEQDICTINLIFHLFLLLLFYHISFSDQIES